MTNFREYLWKAIVLPEKTVWSRPLSLRLGIGVVAVALGWLAREACSPVFGPTRLPFIFFFPALAVTAWFGGLWPALSAMALSAITASWFFIEPRHSFAVSSGFDLAAILAFAVAGLFIIGAIEAMHRSIEHRRRIERELAQQKEWFRVTLTSIGDAVMVIDRDGRVAFMNSEAERLTGWTLGEAEHKALRTVFRILNEDTRDTVEDPVEKVFREGRVIGLANHTMLISKKGIECPIEDSAAPIRDVSANVTGVVLVFRDATESRQAQRALKSHSDELERKVMERTIALHRTINELQAFSYTVSHDLRAPLRTMQGYAQMLLEERGASLDPTGREYLERISAAAERLDVLIQDLLTYSRIEGETHRIEPIDLDGLVTAIVNEYPSLKEAEDSIAIRRPLAPVMAHEPGLTQVLSNLLTNAIKFRRDGQPSAVTVSTEEKEHTVRIWIEDNGIGIRPEDQSRIFKMFEQVDPKAFPGTGMGLAIVKKAVEKMQGAAGVESALGEGSRFWVELLKPKTS